LLVVCPVVSPYLPAAHGPTQELVVCTPTLPKRPRLHGLQAEAPVPLNCPAGQVDCVADVEPRPQKYPAVQSPVQELTAMAVVAPNLPAGHWVQDAVFPRLNWPAGHAEAVADVDPATHM